MDQVYCDALRFAIDYEQNGLEYYRQAANKTANKFACRALMFLADEESEHIRKIEEFNRSLLGLSEFDLEKECLLTLPSRVMEFIDASKTSDRPKAEPNISDIAVYDLAMETEKQGFEIYASARDTNKDKRLKRFFSFLAKEETIHFKLLESSKQYLEDRSYYFEEAGGWIFG